MEKLHLVGCTTEGNGLLLAQRPDADAPATAAAKVTAGTNGQAPRRTATAAPATVTPPA